MSLLFVCDASLLSLRYIQANIMPVLSKHAALLLQILILHYFFSYSQTLVVQSFEQETKVESAGFRSIDVIESVWPMKEQRMLLSCKDQYIIL